MRLRVAEAVRKKGVAGAGSFQALEQEWEGMAAWGGRKGARKEGERRASCPSLGSLGTARMLGALAWSSS